MKKLNIIACILIVLFATGCRRELDANDIKFDQKIVIEGNVTNGEDAVVIRVTKSGGIQQTSKFDKVNTATVSVEVDGVAHNISGTGEGYYRYDGFTPVAGKRYNLTVKVSGKTYTASTIFPDKIDATLISSDSGMYSSNNRIQKIAVEYNAGDNYIRIKDKVNEAELNGDFYNMYSKKNKVAGDTSHIFNHVYKYDPVNPDLPYPFLPGDSIVSQICSIDKVTFEYFEKWLEAKDQGLLDYNPFNPKNNFNETDVYGYFGSSNVTTVKYYVP